MPFKILSLDGGGSWAILQAMALERLYGSDVSGHTILGRFDLAAANSGGSIVLAGLALDLTPRQIITLLNDESMRKLIFVRNFLSFTGVERYDTKAKLNGLRQVFGVLGDKPLDSLPQPTKLLISTFDYDRARAQFFRSDAQSPATSSPGAPQPTLAEAVHAASNAPIKYFDAPAEFNSPAFTGRRFWDGALGGFNNPVMAAVTEALAYGSKPDNIEAITIGTANVFLPMPSPISSPGSGGQNPLCVPIDNSGLYHDLNKAATSILDDPPDQASFVAHLVIDGATALSHDPEHPVTDGKVVRFNPLIQPIKKQGQWSAPPLLAHAPSQSNVSANHASDMEAFMALVQLEIDAVEQDDVDLISTLGNTWLSDACPNQPIRANSDLQPLIGHGRFSLALAQAKALGLG